MKNSKPKILVILGPTASGKSDLAVALAKKLNGEVVSADSRQVYKGLNIGSGKITKREMRGITHHLIDIAQPKKRFTVNDYQKLAYKAIDSILERNKLPIICGGSGFYTQAIVDGIVIPDVDPMPELRKKLAEFSTPKLFSMLRKLDHQRAKIIDPNNRPRLIRAIEISKSLGKTSNLEKKPLYDSLQIGVRFSLPLLRSRIEERIKKRIKKGMIDEVRDLHARGLSFKRLNELGLEYRYISEYLQKKITKNEMIDVLNTKIFQYAKRQITWFKKDKRIWWFDIE